MNGKHLVVLLQGQVGAPDTIPAQLLGSLLTILLLSVAIYVLAAWALASIASKTGTPSPWMAWVPIANLVLMVRIARRPGWWSLLLFVPLVNFVVGVILWMDIAEARGRPRWMGALILVPLVNLGLIFVLATGDGSGREATLAPAAAATSGPAGSVCSSCGRVNRAGLRFCTACGTSLPG